MFKSRKRSDNFQLSDEDDDDDNLLQQPANYPSLSPVNQRWIIFLFYEIINNLSNIRLPLRNLSQ